MSKLTSKEIEKITRPRDLKNMKRAVRGIVKNNDDDDLMNINGGDIYIINENFKITYMDLKPTLKYDFRRQYYFELEIIYPNGTKVDSWARHKGFSNRQYVAFTDEHRITKIRQKDIYEVIKELEEKRPTEVLTKDKDQYGNPETDFRPVYGNGFSDRRGSGAASPEDQDQAGEGFHPVCHQGHFAEPGVYDGG